jgi:hypothetical protein
MRIALLLATIIAGGFIGTNAITAVSEMQDAKMTRFCAAVPVGASYDDTCAKYR